jgi:hypothetical protein
MLYPTRQGRGRDKDRMIALQVPYEQKDTAKAMGARWDAARKIWFVPDGVLATPFERWMPAHAGMAKKPPKKSSQKKGGKKRPAKRVDGYVGKRTVGKDYKESVGAVGPPWD